MDMNGLFTTALGLRAPWTVTKIEFSEQERRLDLVLDFERGSRFPCPVCGEESKVHDSEQREWRHLNFFQFETYLRARQPRTKCEKDGVKVVPVPWARPGAGFTLLFEALVMEFVRNGMTMAATARLVNEHDTRLWRIVEHYVEEALSRQVLASLSQLGIDETARARGHRYITMFVDLEQRRVVFIALGKDGGTLKAFKEELEKRGGAAANIREISVDMSAAFIAGATEHFPDAKLTFDKFHIIKLLNEAIDQVRRAEQKKRPELKRTRYLWLRNEKDLKEAQRAQLDALRSGTLATARALAYREQFQGLYDQPDWETAFTYFDKWYQGAARCRLKPIQRVARTLRDHRYGVLRWFDSKVNNSLLEGFASLVQAAKARARGFRTDHHMRLVIHALLSKLDFRLPNPGVRALPI